MSKMYSRPLTIDGRLRPCFTNRNVTIEEMAMKKVLLCVLALLPLVTHSKTFNTDDNEK